MKFSLTRGKSVSPLAAETKQFRGGYNGLTDNELCSKSLNWLRFPMIVLVCYIHYVGIPAETGLTGESLFEFVRSGLNHVISSVAVPMFGLISGYYFFFKSQTFTKDTYIGKLRKRVHTLVVPYFIWIAFAICFNLLTFNAPRLLHGGTFDMTSIIGHKNLFQLFFGGYSSMASYDVFGNEFTRISGPYLGPMWYVRDLMVMALFSPLIFWCVKKLKFLPVLVLMAFTFCRVLIVNTDVLLYFTIGATFAILGKNVVTEFRRVRTLSFIIYPIFTVLMILLDGNRTMHGNQLIEPYVLVSVITWVNFAAWLMEKGIAREHSFLTGAVFFIYAAHMIKIISWSGGVVQRLLPWQNEFVNIVRYISAPILCVIMCLALYRLMQRFTPRTLALLTGNRR